jgi:hypothetical protein
MELFNYKILFSVIFQHDYYKNGLCPDFITIPTDNTSKILRKTGLIFKSNRTGFHVLGDTEQQGSNFKLKKEFEKNQKLTFLLKLNKYNFINFTDIPINKDKNQVFYFNNLTSYESSGNLFLINKDEIPKTSANNSLIKLASKYYKYFYTGTGTNKTAILSFPDDGIILNKSLENNSGEFDFQFDLSNYNTGRCEFNVDAITDKFYSANEYYGQNIFAIIEIFIKDTVPSNYQFIDSSFFVQKKEYIIPFTNRSTIWRYFVYDKITNSLNNPNIIMSGREFKLETALTTEYPDKYSLYKFTSVEPGVPTNVDKIPLTEEKITSIKLHGEINAISKDIIMNMPNPDVSLIKPDITDTNKIFSDIIIYV